MSDWSRASDEIVSRQAVVPQFGVAMRVGQ
jgi:hypothetical protein